jgi:hypothetical protein
MSDLEHRLRAAFLARAREVLATSPPLQLPPGSVPSAIRCGDGVPTLARKRRLVPAGTALAVLAVIAGTLAASRVPTIPRLTVAIAPVQLSIPRYYVELDTKAALGSFPEPAGVATIRITATGVVVARVVPPRPYVGFTAVTGAADDRTFVLLARAPTDPFTELTPERFYLLRINPGAPSAAVRARLTPLPPADIPGEKTAADLPFGEEVGAMALSPDGRSLAALLSVRGGNDLYIYNLVTGTTRIWIRKLCAGCKQAALGNADGAYDFEHPGMVKLSWTADGRSLAFISGPGVSQVRLLRVGARGDNVQPNSTPFVIHAPVSTWSQAVMSPDGKTVFLSFNFAFGVHGYAVSNKLMRFSSATGQLVTINTVPLILVDQDRTRFSFGGPLLADTILWTNYNGSEVIVADAGPGHTLGVYSGGTYTPLPWSAHAYGAAW